jgi:hypothetical protein
VEASGFEQAIAITIPRIGMEDFMKIGFESSVYSVFSRPAGTPPTAGDEKLNLPSSTPTQCPTSEK